VPLKGVVRPIAAAASADDVEPRGLVSGAAGTKAEVLRQQGRRDVIEGRPNHEEVRGSDHRKTPPHADVSAEALALRSSAASAGEEELAKADCRMPIRLP